MNEQNSDSSTTSTSSPTAPISEKLSETKKTKQSLLKKWFHKTESIPPVSSATPAAIESPQTPPLPKKRISFFGNMFHKREHAHASATVSSTEPVPTKEENTLSVTDTPSVIDERFSRLLKQDNVYHSMIRSEDIKNIQLQLSMRYMLLLLAIFVVIAWIVNNRVIMFGFSDFPLLARTRDGLFALLTGLFALTIWFGSAVWFQKKILSIVLRVTGGILFIAVLVSIYLPFWR